MFSLLAKVGEVIRDPFPYVVIKDALQNYRELAESRPKITGTGENKRIDMPSLEVLASTNKPWVEFVGYHTSVLFLDEIRALFGFSFPYSAGPRGRSYELGMECQPGINTPLTKPARVRGPHLDNPRELYGGMLYMRLAEDDSTGGDLQIYRWIKPKRFYGKLECFDEDVEVVAQVPYEANVFVLFMNSIDAVHGVSVRSPSQHPRLLVNVAADFKRPLFRTGHGPY